MTTRSDGHFVETRFEDCRGCIFYAPGRRQPACTSCDFGENFEPRIQETVLTQREFNEMWRLMTDDDAE